MSTTFEELIFRSARQDEDGKVTLEFYTKDMKHGKSYTLNPRSTNRIARELSNITLDALLTYVKKKQLKCVRDYGAAISTLKGKTILCEIHDECMNKFESHRLQTIVPKK